MEGGRAVSPKLGAQVLTAGSRVVGKLLASVETALRLANFAFNNLVDKSARAFCFLAPVDL